MSGLSRIETVRGSFTDYCSGPVGVKASLIYSFCFLLDQLKYVPPESEMYYGDGDSSLRGSSSAGENRLKSS
jgi:hypothetical protein